MSSYDSMLTTLGDMGFGANRAKRGLKATGCQVRLAKDRTFVDWRLIIEFGSLTQG